MNERKTPRDLLDELLEGKRAPGSPDIGGLNRLDRLTRRQPPEEPSVSKTAPPDGPAPAKNAQDQPPAMEPAGDVPFLFVTRSPAPAQHSPKELAETAAPNARANTAPVPGRPAVSAKQQAKNAKTAAKKRPRKKKTTHYLSKDTFEELSKAKKAIRRLAPREIKTGVSKSLIVDSALQLLLEDFETNGERSKLVQKVLDSRDKS